MRGGWMVKMWYWEFLGGNRGFGELAFRFWELSQSHNPIAILGLVINQIPQISRFACYIPLSFRPTGGLTQPPSLATWETERVDKKEEDSQPPQIPPAESLQNKKKRFKFYDCKNLVTVEALTWRSQYNCSADSEEDSTHGNLLVFLPLIHWHAREWALLSALPEIAGLMGRPVQRDPRAEVNQTETGLEQPMGLTPPPPPRPPSPPPPSPPKLVTTSTVGLFTQH